MEPFKHDFGEDAIENRVAIMMGYMQALQQVFNYLKEKTEFNPAKRFIDAVPLAEKIVATCGEIEILQTDYKTELSLLQLFQKNDL